MSELEKNPELEPTVQLLSDGLEHWLKKEIGSSLVGRNSYLDDFHDFRDSLERPYGDYRNANSEKNRSHHNRLIDWTNGFVEHYEGFNTEQRDYATARQIFCAQMYLSGLFRVQCFMQATGQEDYYRRRTDGQYIGIDLGRAITRGLRSTIGFVPETDGFGTVQITPAELREQTMLRNEKQLTYIKELHKTGRYDVARESSSTVDTILELQEAWTRDIVNYVAFAAQERDGQLSTVPFLEPKSISDEPAVYLPFVATV